MRLRSAPKDDQACSFAEAFYGSPMMLPGMFLDPLEFLSEIFKSRIRSVNFSAPPNHHVRATAPAIPASLKIVTHVFVRDDSSTPPLRGQYLILQ